MHHEYRSPNSYHAVPADRRNKTLERWLATLNTSSAITSHALEQIDASWFRVVCKSYARVLQVLLAACFQLYSFQLAIQLVFPSYTLQLPSICVLPTAFNTFCSNKLGIPTGTSWCFSDMSRDMSAPWVHECTLPDVNKANGMLTSNAKSIFCNNVTCFARSKSFSNRSHLQECFKCSSLLAFNGTAFNLFSNESFPHTPYGFPLSVPCRLLLRHSVRTSWDFSLEQVGISPKCQVKYLLGGCMKSTSLNVNKANGMLTSNANSSFPTLSRALEQVNAARIGVIYKSASIAPHFLLARVHLSNKTPRIYSALSSCHALLADRRNKRLEWSLAQAKAARIGVICTSASSKFSDSSSSLHRYSVSIRKIQGSFLEGDIRTTPNCPGRNNSHFALEYERSNMSLVNFSFGILPGSFRFRAWCEDFQFRGVSAQKLCQASGDFSLEQVGIAISAPCTPESGFNVCLRNLLYICRCQSMLFTSTFLQRCSPQVYTQWL